MGCFSLTLVVHGISLALSVRGGRHCSSDHSRHAILDPFEVEPPALNISNSTKRLGNFSVPSLSDASTARRWGNFPEERAMTSFRQWEKDHHVSRNFQLVFGIGLLAWLCLSTAHHWKQRSASPEYLRCIIMALRSSVAAFALFLAAGSTWLSQHSPSLPFMEAFQNLPTYMSIAVQTKYGKYLAMAWYALIGSSLPLFWVYCLNYIMVGGASKAVEVFPEDGQLSLNIGFGPVRATCALLLFVYLVSASSLDLNGKFYALMIFASLAPAFLNPHMDPTTLRGVIYYADKDGQPHFSWNIYGSSEFMVVVGVILGGLCLIPFPESRLLVGIFGPKDDRSNLTQAQVDLAALACKIGGSLKNLVSCLREADTAFELDAMSKVVYSLGDHLKEIEVQLYYAWWETFTKRSRKRADDIEHLTQMFKELKWILISIISCIRSRKSGPTTIAQIAMISSYLEDFLQHSSDAIGNLVQHVGIDGPERSSLKTQINSCLVLANGSLLQAEERLQGSIQEPISPEVFSSNATPLVFIDCLRKWHAILHRYNNAEGAMTTVATNDSYLKTLQRHGKAAKITIGFGIMLWWSAQIASFNSRGVLAYVMCGFGKGIGSKTRGAVLRFIGITSGTIIAGIPGAVFKSNHFDWLGHHAMFLYSIWYVIIWIVLMYCILREDVYSGPALTAIAWTFYEMIRNVQIINRIVPRQEDYFWEASVNEMVGMLTVIFVDFGFAWLSGTGTTRSAVRATEKVLDEVRDVVRCMIEGKPPDAPRLLANIEKARAWNAELQGVDRLWSLPWKYDFLEEILDQCSSMYVVASSMQGAEFNLDKEVSRKIMQELMPPNLPEKMQDLNEAIVALLQQEVPHQKEVQEVLGRKKLDQRNFCTASSDGRNVASFLEQAATFTEVRNTKSFLKENLAEHLTCEADFAAVAPILHGLLSIRDSIKNIEVLIQMQMFVSFGRWDICGALLTLKPLDFHKSEDFAKS